MGDESKKGGRTTIFDVAERAGVSISTVSLVLHQDTRVAGMTRKAVEKAIEELQYRPNISAQALAYRKNNLIAIFGWFDFYAPNYQLMQMGCMKRLKESEYALYLESLRVGTPAHTLVRKFAQKRFISGIVVLGENISGRDIALFKELGMPVVITERRNPLVDSIIVDNHQGGQLAGDYLSAKGFRSLAMLSVRPAGPFIREREEGFHRALEKGGSVCPKTLTRWSRVYTYEAGYGMMKDLIDRGRRFDAVFCPTGDLMAMGAINALIDSGRRVPDDVAVMGYDDIRESEYFNPPLTTVHQPLFDLGYSATDRLIDIIESNAAWDYDAREFVLQPRLIIRRSA